jgi:hypothetical chaperone protein
MSPPVGIDFGTSNSAAVLHIGGGVAPVALDAQSTIADTSPTLLYFGESPPAHFGTAAIRAYIEHSLTGRLLQAIKKHLPSPGFDGTYLFGRFRPVEEIVAGYLAYVRASVEAQAGEKVTQVLLGRPARFHADPTRDALAERRLVKAARIAGFTEIELQLEPIAAARSFERSLSGEVLCLVGDLGGGTSDFTVMRLSPERAGQRDRAGDVLGSAGVPVGGTDFDARILMRAVLPHLGMNSDYAPEGRVVPLPTALHLAVCRWHTLALASSKQNMAMLDYWLRSAHDQGGLKWLRELLDQNYGYLLFQAVERLKVALSQEEVARLTFEAGSIRLDVPMSRREFEAAIAPEVGEVAQSVDGLLTRLNLRPDDIGVVFLTGGSSKVPLVKRLFAERFGSRIVAEDEFTSIASGLGIEAGERFSA